MSNDWLNIRFLFWHLTCSHDKGWGLEFNKHWLHWRVLVKPGWIYTLKLKG